MAILKRIFLFLVALVVLLLGIGFLLPHKIHVERSTSIDAPRATVFALVDGFRSFNRWSPWYGVDPQAKYSYEGPDFGVGARMSWVGDPKTVGSGSQEIVEVRPMAAVTTNIDFGDQGKATGRFRLGAEGRATAVTWTFDTDVGANPISRYFGLTFDRLIGPDYEKGLQGLKRLAESLPKTDFSDLKVEKVDVAPVTVAYLPATSSKDEQAIAQAIGGAYLEVGNFMAAHGLKQAGAPITIDTRWDEAGYSCDAAIPVDRAPEGEIAAESAVKVRQTYSGQALKVVHTGAYRDLPAAYEKLHAFIAAHGYQQAGPAWDEYVSDPGTTPEADLITNVYVPVKYSPGG